jgi:hypothetical protein
MGFVLTEVPSYALGMRSPLTLDSTIIRRICGKVIPSIGVVLGGTQHSLLARAARNVEFPRKEAGNLGLTFHCGWFPFTAVLAK